MVRRLERFIEPASLPHEMSEKQDDERQDDATSVESLTESDVLPSEWPDEEPSAAWDTADVAAASAVTPAEPSTQAHAQVAQLVASISVQRRADGGVRIDAPPEAAAVLATMFGKMSELLAEPAAY